MGESIMGEQAAWDPTQANAKMVEYEERYFESVLVDELFYLSNKRNDADSFRKIDEQTAMNIRSRETFQFELKKPVYVKN